MFSYFLAIIGLVLLFCIADALYEIAKELRYKRLGKK